MHWKSEKALEISYGCKKYTMIKKVILIDGIKSKSFLLFFNRYMLTVIQIMLEMTVRIIGKIPTKSTLT